MEQYDPKKNYCGPEGLFSFPNEFWGVNVNYECYQHDLAYQKGGTDSDRKKADILFYRTMMWKVKGAHSKWNPQYWLAWRRVRKMYLICRATGWKFFNEKGKS
jgi:hypothetical protein